MKRLISVLFAVTAIVAALSPALSLANHETIPVLRDKVPVMQTLCKSDGMQGQGDATDVPCFLFVEPGSKTDDGSRYWVALWDNLNEEFYVVFERTIGNDVVRAAWKKGMKSA